MSEPVPFEARWSMPRLMVRASLMGAMACLLLWVAFRGAMTRHITTGAGLTLAILGVGSGWFAISALRRAFDTRVQLRIAAGEISGAALGAEIPIEAIDRMVDTSTGLTSSVVIAAAKDDTFHQRRWLRWTHGRGKSMLVNFNGMDRSPGEAVRAFQLVKGGAERAQ